MTLKKETIDVVCVQHEEKTIKKNIHNHFERKWQTEFNNFHSLTAEGSPTQMRYSDLDLVASPNSGRIRSKNCTMADSKIVENDLDINCNEQSIDDILDICSISDGEECNTEKSDNTVNNNHTTESATVTKKKPKKRVMFKCGDSLVMIREIPPREPSPEEETSEESCSDDSESESTESDSEGSDQSCSNKSEAKPSRKINPRVARIIREAPLEIKQKDPPVRKPTKKRINRRTKKEHVTKESSQNKAIEKVSLRPKQIHIKGPEKDNLKIADSKPSKPHIKRKKVVPVNRVDSPVQRGNIDCRNSKIVLSERLKQKPAKILLSKRERQVDSPKISESSEQLSEHCAITELSQSGDRPLSQSDKRLYSWLLANGRIPGPEQQSPCISPMWDTKQSGFLWDAKLPVFSNNSVVKAPT